MANSEEDMKVIIEKVNECVVEYGLKVNEKKSKVVCINGEVGRHRWMMGGCCIEEVEEYNILKGKMHSNCRLLPEDIVCKITQRNNIRRANTTCDPALKLLNEELTSDIQKHKQNI